MQGPVLLSNIVVGRLAECQGQEVSTCVRTMKRVRTCPTLSSAWNPILESKYVKIRIDEAVLRN